MVAFAVNEFSAKAKLSRGWRILDGIVDSEIRGEAVQVRKAPSK